MLVRLVNYDNTFANYLWFSKIMSEAVYMSFNLGAK